MLEINGHAPREARNLAERLLAHVRMNRLSSDYFVTGGIPQAAMADLADADYVRAAIRRVLQDTIGFEEFADDLRFEVIPDRAHPTCGAAETQRNIRDGTHAI
jgi:hypothetical protein